MPPIRIRMTLTTSPVFQNLVPEELPTGHSAAFEAFLQRRESLLIYDWVNGIPVKVRPRKN